MTQILNIYEMASGQRLNQAKTSIFFSRNTPVKAQEEILRLSRIPSIQRYEKYLGLPALLENLAGTLLQILRREYGGDLMIGS